MDDIIAKALAAPKNFRVITTYADGRERTHDTATAAQAEMWAIGERRKIGVAKIDRETGATVSVKSVEIVNI